MRHELTLDQARRIAAGVVAGFALAAGFIAPAEATSNDIAATNAGEGRLTVRHERPDVSSEVRVEVSADAAPDTFREVWLITADASALVSLGVLEGTAQTFAIPADVNLSDYVLVDVSQEPVDGDPAPSGDSIVRGELTFL